MNQNNKKMKRLLIVDDDPVIKDLMVNIAQKRGEFDTKTAASGLEAINLILSEPPFHMILTDLVMPEKSGLKVKIIMDK